MKVSYCCPRTSGGRELRGTAGADGQKIGHHCFLYQILPIPAVHYMELGEVLAEGRLDEGFI